MKEGKISKRELVREEKGPSVGRKKLTTSRAACQDTPEPAFLVAILVLFITTLMKCL